MSSHSHMTAANEVHVERIRKYLRRLTSQARSSLLVEIERMQKYEEDISGFEIILPELRTEFRNSGHTHDRTGNPSRHFFKPIEVLLVDRSPEHANSGQISRGSLAPIWEWITQTLLPSMAREYCERMNELILMNDSREARSIAAGFRSKAVKYIETILASDGGVASVQHGLGRYTSSHAILNDLRKLLSGLRMRDALAAFSDELPAKIESFEGDPLVKARTLLDVFTAQYPEAMPFALITLAKRLAVPWQLMNLATNPARKTSAKAINATRYAISISMVLDYLDDKQIELAHVLSSNRIQIARSILVEIYDIEYAMHARIDRIEETDWGRRLDRLMASVSSNLQDELQTLPKKVHHVLASRTLHRHHSERALLASLIRRGSALIGLNHR